MSLVKFIASIYAMRIKCHRFIYKMSLAYLSDRVAVVMDEFQGNEEDVVYRVAGLVKVR